MPCCHGADADAEVTSKGIVAHPQSGLESARPAPRRTPDRPHQHRPVRGGARSGSAGRGAALFQYGSIRQGREHAGGERRHNLGMTSSSEEPQAARAFVCPRCERPALAVVRGVAIWDGWNRERTDLVNSPAEYALIQCNECKQASVQVREDFGEGFDDDNPVVVYPAPRRLSWEVPSPLRREFEEAQTCFSSKAYEATAVMVRRILEGTCKESGIQSRTLVEGLKKLEEEGHIDSTIAEWANALRLVGNEGAHYTGKQVSRDDAEDALAFAETLLDHIYVLRKRFEEFAERRESARGKPAKNSDA